MNNKLKIFATFIGLKLLEIAAVLGAFAIAAYVVLALDAWSIHLGSILDGIGTFLAGAWLLFVVSVGLVIWITSNWQWAKRIVNKDA